MTTLNSLSKTAQQQGHLLETTVIEKAIRLPLEDELWFELEKKAQKSVGLAEIEPFIFIIRFRKLIDSPADTPSIAMHRLYLNPARFVDDFINKHDFEKKSLAEIYEAYGYELTRRDTTLQARLANQYERVDFKTHGYDISQFHAVLHAEQEHFAKNKNSEEGEFCLEFLQACYVNWNYTIKNRPTG